MQPIRPYNPGMPTRDPKDDRKDPKGNKNDPKDDGKRKGVLAAFMPGDKQMLAEQLSFGFGGGPLANMRYLSQTYSPMRAFPLRFGVGMGGGNGNPTQIDPNASPVTSGPPQGVRGVTGNTMTWGFR